MDKLDDVRGEVVQEIKEQVRRAKIFREHKARQVEFQERERERAERERPQREQEQRRIDKEEQKKAAEEAARFAAKAEADRRKMQFPFKESEIADKLTDDGVQKLRLWIQELQQATNDYVNSFLNRITHLRPGDVGGMWTTWRWSEPLIRALKEVYPSKSTQLDYEWYDQLFTPKEYDPKVGGFFSKFDTTLHPLLLAESRKINPRGMTANQMKRRPEFDGVNKLIELLEKMQYKFREQRAYVAGVRL